MIKKLLGLIVVGLLAGPMAAVAAPVLVSSGGKYVGINGLDVGGTIYSVTWQEGSYNAVFGAGSPAFLGDSVGAEAAANAIISFFNASNVFPVDLGGGLACSSNSLDCDLVIPYAAAAASMDAFNADWTQASGPWALQPQNWSRDFDNDLVAMAIFQRVPEPGTLALLGVGLAGLAASRRRKQ